MTARLTKDRNVDRLADRITDWRILAAAGVGGLLILTRVVPHEVPLGTVLYGVLYGSLNGLLALGLVLTFKVTRAINFSYGAMGGLPAGIGASIYLSHRWPWSVVVLFSLLIGAVVGFGVGALINWRFSKSPRLVLTVASIGLAQLLGGIGLYVPRWFHGPALIASFQTGLSAVHTEIKPVLFNGNDLVVVAVVPLVVVAVSWWLLATDAGRAVRAIADNPDRARLLAIPARRLLLGVWTLGGVVAALAVILQAPRAGVPLDAAAGPAILLPPLAAAVVARMDSLVVAFVAAVVLGVMESVVRLDVSKQSVETPLFLGVILIALLLQHRSENRAETSDDSSWSAIGDLRPIASYLRTLPEVRAAKGIALMALAAVLLTLPAFVSPGRLDQVSIGLVFALAALSLVVLSGWTGTISLGQFALVGVGAVVAGDLMMHFDLDFFLSMAAACVAAAVVAVVLGLPALRVRGLYLAVTTLAFAVAANDFFFNPTNFAKQLPSSVVRPVLWKRFPLHGEGDVYLLCLGVLALSIVLARGIRAARSGRVILATRDNIRAAEAAAIPTARTRLMAFTVAGVIAGAAGALYVVILGGVGYQTFQPVDSITVFSMVVIGGLSSIGGSLAGVALIQWIGIEFPKAQLLLTGVGLLVVLMVLPSGLAGLYERARDRLVVAVARRRGLDTSAWATVDETGGDADEATRELLAVSSDDDLLDPRVLLECRNVCASYGQMQVLFGVDLTVREGEIVALLGTNGAGKSSLLRAVTGLLPSNEGRVAFGTADVTGHPTEAIARMGLTMMPGGRGVFPSLTVAENLRVASWPLRADRSAATEARRRVTDLFPVLSERSAQTAGNLSGGEQQMLSLAMAFLVRPRLLCIDELSLGLAPTVVSTLLDAVREIHRQGTTVLIVEQSVNVALLLAERATFLEKGQVRFSGPAADLLDRPDLLRAVFIGCETAHQQRPVTVTTNGGQVEELATSVSVLECADLVKRFGGITAVDHVDLSIRRGEVVGLIGHNGAGKTTLFDVMCGFLASDEGRVRIFGEDVTDWAPHERAWAGLGRSFQEARLFPSLTVAETIAVALERHVANRDPFAAAFRMPASTDSEAAVAERVDDLVEELGLTAFRDRPAGLLSTGTRRILELACVMAQRPDVLLLDEPSGGVAQAETEALAPLLRRVVSDTGCSIVVIEHDMTLISSLCDRLIALELGRIIAEGSPDEVLSHPDVIASYLGTDADAVARSGRRQAPARARSGAARPAIKGRSR
ncbi:MAG TPA: ATP-binding cassette domain-containing protein [Acidimicrobiales bacterium]